MESRVTSASLTGCDGTLPSFVPPARALGVPVPALLPGSALALVVRPGQPQDQHDGDGGAENAQIAVPSRASRAAAPRRVAAGARAEAR